MRVQSISSKNLLHVFKKKLINSRELNQFFINNPSVNRRVGSLPFDFFSRIPDADKALVTKQVGDVFEKFAIESEKLEETTTIYEYGIDEIAERMQNSLKKILNRDDIEVSYVGSGSFKNCQRLKVGNYSYAVSIFKKYPIYSEQGYFNDSHGKGNEAQNIFTTYKKYSHGRVSKPFLTNLSAEDDSGGFILGKFIDNNSPQKRSLGRFLSQRTFMKNTDVKGNSINGIFIESGGFILNKKYIENSDVRRDWKYFAECFDANVELLKSELANKVQIKLYNAIENNDENVFETFSKEELKIAKKLIKHLSRINTLVSKTKNLDEVKKLLNEDLSALYPFENYSLEFNENNSIEDVYKGYPLLLTKVLGINNAPEFSRMVELVEESCGIIEVDFLKYYSKQECISALYNYKKQGKDYFALDMIQKSLKN